MAEGDETPLEAAIREFFEETGIRPVGPYLPLGSIRQKGGKVVHAWAWEGDADPSSIVSNETKLEWPRNSGRWITFPEIDRCGWFAVADAARSINPAQAELLERVLEMVQEGG
jgi:predicted NUDIX family NTP pyrophosphohydrolase